MKDFLMKTLHQSYFLVAMCVGIIIGVVLGLVFRINYFASSLWILFAVVLFVIAYLKPRLVFVVLAFLAGMIIAFFKIANELQGENYIRQLYDEIVVVVGTVKGDPETDTSGTKVKLVNLKFGENGEHSTSGSVYISLRYSSDIARSDEIVVRGKVTAGFGTYSGYMYKPEILSLKRPEPGDLTLKIRNWFADRIRGLIPEPQVNLGLSYLLGMNSGLPDDLAENLRIVGLVHIVVASGAHLSSLVEIARKVFGKISRFAGLLFSVLFIVFFMAMVGWTPSILRAGIMTILALSAWYVGRKIAPWRIILMVAAVTLIINPMFIIDIGWLLSFASFAGIMMIGPWLTKNLYGAKKPGFVAAMVITTISATLMTLPIILYFYGTVSLISVIANILILPTLPYAMGLVFLTGVLAEFPGIGVVASFLATRLLDFHIAVVEFFGEMTYFLVKIEPYQSWVFWIYLVTLVMAATIYLKKRNVYGKMRVNI